jgi:hypothetical protein
MRTLASFNNINSFAIHIIFIKSRMSEIRNKYQNVKMNIKPGLINQDYGYNIAKIWTFIGLVSHSNNIWLSHWKKVFTRESKFFMLTSLFYTITTTITTPTSLNKAKDYLIFLILTYSILVIPNQRVSSLKRKG